VPRVPITDKLASDGAAKRDVLPSVEHRRHKGLNNRAENSHQPTRERERRMRRCKSPGHAQRFLAAYGPIVARFRPRRHRLTAAVYRQHRDQPSPAGARSPASPLPPEQTPRLAPARPRAACAVRHRLKLTVPSAASGARASTTSSSWVSASCDASSTNTWCTATRFGPFSAWGNGLPRSARP